MYIYITYMTKCRFLLGIVVVCVLRYKYKIVPVLSEAPYHEGILESGGAAPHICDCGIEMEMPQSQ
jgi:hypothetical protein